MDPLQLPMREKERPDLFRPCVHPPRKINWLKLWAVSAIALAIFAPVAAVLAAGSIPLSERKIGAADPAPRPSSAFSTASPDRCIVNMTAAALEYLKHGRVQAQEFSTEISPEPFENSVERAMALHQEREKFYRDIQTDEAFEQVYYLLFDEVNACQEAADQTEDPQMQMQWIQRACKELTKQFDVFGFHYRLEGEKFKELMLTRALLWKQTAEIFLKLSSEESKQWTSLFYPTDYEIHLFAYPAYCAAHAFFEAATLSNYHDTETSLKYTEEAIQLLSQLDMSSWPIAPKARCETRCEKRIAQACERIRDNKLRTPQSAAYAKRCYIKAFEVYNQSDLPRFKLRACRHLWFAADLAENADERISLLVKGKNLLQELQEKQSDPIDLLGNEYAHACSDQDRRRYTLLQCFELRLKEEQTHSLTHLARDLLNWFFT